MTYPEYLKTEHWQTMRRLALEAAGHRCLLCDVDANLDVHHRTYERVGVEQVRDLVVLCDACHGRHHGLFEQAERAWTESEQITVLESELAAEIAGAAFLARHVELAWLDGIAEGMRRNRSAA
jgi:hypothetical protein